MTGAETETRVLALLAGHMRTPTQPDPHTDIIADTGMDSVAVMDFVLDLEEDFDITIPLDRLADVRTVADIARAVDGIVSQSAR